MAALVAVAFIPIVLLRVGIVLPVGLLTRLGTVTLVLDGGQPSFDVDAARGKEGRVRSPARDD